MSYKLFVACGVCGYCDRHLNIVKIVTAPAEERVTCLYRWIKGYRCREVSVCARVCNSLCAAVKVVCEVIYLKLPVSFIVSVACWACRNCNRCWKSCAGNSRTWPTCELIALSCGIIKSNIRRGYCVSSRVLCAELTAVENVAYGIAVNAPVSGVGSVACWTLGNCNRCCKRVEIRTRPTGEDITCSYRIVKSKCCSLNIICCGVLFIKLSTRAECVRNCVINRRPNCCVRSVTCWARGYCYILCNTAETRTGPA